MSTDILTGLPNRFSYEQKCKDINSKRPIALIVAYIDVDGLHALNDERGHMAGDLMLKYFAEKLGQAFGELNVYRIGGDEFVGFIPSTDEQGALAALSAINEETIEDGYHLSFGVAVYKEFKLIESVIREAEGKMYTAKSEYYASSGKDRRKQ